MSIAFRIFLLSQTRTPDGCFFGWHLYPVTYTDVKTRSWKSEFGLMGDNWPAIIGAHSQCIDLTAPSSVPAGVMQNFLPVWWLNGCSRILLTIRLLISRTKWHHLCILLQLPAAAASFAIPGQPREDYSGTSGTFIFRCDRLMLSTSFPQSGTFQLHPASFGRVVPSHESPICCLLFNLLRF